MRVATKAAYLAAIALFAPSAGAAEHHYVVSVDSEMRNMQVVAEFSNAVDYVAARDNDASSYLLNVHDCESDERVRLRNRRMLLPKNGSRCLRYSVNLRQAARAERRNAALSDANFIVSPSSWFWRPELQENDRITVRFELPESVPVSVPWPRIPGQENAYLVEDSPESSSAFTAFGDFRLVEASIPGAVLRITIMQPEREANLEPIIKWVRDTALTINLAYGRFPNPQTNVVILPGRGRWGSNDAVSFGRVVRDGGETIELFVNPAKPIAEFYDDWTATHEFSHLMLPYLRGDHRWISEGFATYYQNLLMARAGRYSEQRAWQKLWEGFERGRNSRPEMSPNEAARAGVRAATMKIYWSGAALALMADVELRQRSGGRESLDTVLGQLAECCLPAEKSWSGTQLFQQLDTLLDEPVFMPLYRRYANSAGFPDVRPLLRELGVAYDRQRVQLNKDADLASLRQAMTATP
jgi:hypothetical protein